MRKLILTGDDFGLALPVNEAIVEAHRHGILTSASLMIAANAAGDAVDRARQLPALHVGLHLVLVDGRAVLPASEIPDLVDPDGNFPSNPVQAGLKYFFMPEARPQLEAEIRAQFLAFQRTGLLLDHVNGHHHMHLHPTILRLVLKIGAEFGLRAMRLPHEPVRRCSSTSQRGLFSRLAATLWLYPWIRLLRSRLRRAGIRCNDFVFGLHDSGALHEDALLRILRDLPPGVTEIYCHPATRHSPELNDSVTDSSREREFQALMSPVVRQAIVASGCQRIGFGQL